MSQGTGVAIAKEPQRAAAPSIATLFLTFLRLGVTCFGGPAMVAYIKEMVVNRKRWLDEETMNDGVVLAQSLPGVIAMDAAAYVGLRLRGIRGAFATYIGFTLPAFLLMLVFAASYMASRSLPRIISLMAGLQVLVVAIVANAAYSFGKSVIKSVRTVIVAALCAALLLAGVNPFVVILLAALLGALLIKNGVTPGAAIATGGRCQGRMRQVALLALPIIAGMVTLYFANRKLFGLALLMMKINVFSFGGGYTALPLMLHEVVNVHHWIPRTTLMDGVALGQVTPGPISITATFIGYVLSGLIGAIVATVAMYSPCFLLLIAVTPYFDRLKSSVTFSRVSKGIAASFVGLLLFATVYFATAVPWDVKRTLLGLAALAALLRKVDILYVVLIGAAISLLLF